MKFAEVIEVIFKCLAIIMTIFNSIYIFIAYLGFFIFADEKVYFRDTEFANLKFTIIVVLINIFLYLVYFLTLVIQKRMNEEEEI